MFMLGVLVQSNFGGRDELRIDGVAVGARIGEDVVPRPRVPEFLVQPRPATRPAALRPGAGPPTPVGGSIIGIAATDAPLLPHQLDALAQRLGIGLARMGNAADHWSGDLFLAFSTANRQPSGNASWPAPLTSDVTALANRYLDPLLQRRGRGDRGGDRQLDAGEPDDGRARWRDGPRPPAIVRARATPALTREPRTRTLPPTFDLITGRQADEGGRPARGSRVRRPVARRGRLVVAACGGSTPPAGSGGSAGAPSAGGGDGGGSGQLTLSLPGPPSARYAGYYAAADQGFFNEAGLDVSSPRASVSSTVSTPSRPAMRNSASRRCCGSWSPRRPAPSSRSSARSCSAPAYRLSPRTTRRSSTPDRCGARRSGSDPTAPSTRSSRRSKKAGLSESDVEFSDAGVPEFLAGELDAVEVVSFDDLAPIFESPAASGSRLTPADVTIFDFNSDFVRPR